MLEYCEAKGIPVKATAKKPYSSDENCLHISYEAGDLEDPTVDGQTVIDFGMTVSPQQAPDREEKISISFESGVPVAVNGKKLTPAALVGELNTLGGKHGIGRIDVVENRFVGMKSRGVYESPGMTLLYAAHQALEQLTLDRDLVHLRDQLSPVVAEMVYYGFWYCAKMDSLMAFIRETEKPVTGEVKLSLYKGNIRISSRTSPNSLYKADIASMEKGGSYDQTDAEGFLRIMGLPVRVQGNVRPRSY
jgi:argininosuccinate synthase